MPASIPSTLVGRNVLGLERIVRNVRTKSLKVPIECVSEYGS